MATAVAAAAAGAELGLGLAWAFVLGGVCLLVLAAMRARFSRAVEGTFIAALRARFGLEVTAVPVVAVLLGSLLVLATALAGCAVALELATGVPFRAWGALAALGIWLLARTARLRTVVRTGTFVALAALALFVAAALRAPPSPELVSHAIGHVPPSEVPRWGFLAAVILGASLAPFVFQLYGQEPAARTRTRAAAVVIGTALSLAALTAAAAGAHGERLEDYRLLPELFAAPLGAWGSRAFVALLGIGCCAAAAELSLVAPRLVAQTFDWPGERRDPRFGIVHTVGIVVASIAVLAGIDPVELTLVAMAAIAITLPVAILPFLVMMNDPRLLGRRRSSLAGHVVVAAVVALAVVLSVVTIPLEMGRG